MSDAIVLTRPELAELLDVHENTIGKWQAQGMPVLRRGRGGAPSDYNFAVAFRWAREAGKFTVAASSHGVSARDRKELAQAVESEQRIAIKARTLIAVADVEKTWGAIVAAVRAKLLALPTSLSDRLHRAAITDGAPGVEALLEESVHEALRELASGEQVGPKTRKRPAKKARRGSGKANCDR